MRLERMSMRGVFEYKDGFRDGSRICVVYEHNRTADRIFCMARLSFYGIIQHAVLEFFPLEIRMFIRDSFWKGFELYSLEGLL
jgi:hypothetical protein